MSSSGDESIGDEHTTALVLGEEAEPRGLSHQDLPRPVAELGVLATHDATRLRQGTDTTH